MEAMPDLVIRPKHQTPDPDLTERVVSSSGSHPIATAEIIAEAARLRAASYVPPLEVVPVPAAAAPTPVAEVPAPAPVAQAPAAAALAAPAAESPAAPTGRPASSYAAAPHDPSKPPVKRQIVAFTFYKIDPAWKRLSAVEKQAHKQAFADTITRWNRANEFLSLTYSTVGTRGDCDMCVWSICYSIEEMNRMRSELLSTPLGGYLSTPHNFLAMTKRSQYQIDREDESDDQGRGAVRPGGHKYIFIYPFWKTRPWYLLPMEERQRLMQEHIRVGLAYPRVKLNTTYSFGIDDQEFVVAFETNFPEDFLDLVQQLRETEISIYTLKDFPIFSCVRLKPLEMLDRLG